MMRIHSPPTLEQARALADARRYPEALNAYRRILDERRAAADIWYEYAWLLRQAGDSDASLTAYSQALALGVGTPEEVHLNRAVIYSDELHQEDRAEAELLAALELNSEYSPARLNLGKLYEDQGRREQALECYRRLADAEHAQDADEALRQEALCRLLQAEPPVSDEDPRLLRLIAAATSARRHSESHRASLWFGVARAWESLGRFDEAFAAFERANALCAETGPRYSAASVSAFVDATVKLGKLPFSPSTNGDPRPTPLFICGMFRSGSTLLEQVLNAHPQVAAGGELAFFPKLALGSLGPAGSGAGAPANALGEARNAYRQLINRLLPQSSAGVRYFTDKRPDNVLLLRLIRQVLPDCRIIITRRHPLDTGLSVFQQHLNPAQVPYSTRLDDIAHYQLQVERLTRHFLSQNEVGLRVFDYDRFVAEPEAELKPLLQWLGLDWDASCLDFHRQGNAVKTASHAQVRRPLYRDASGRWQNYSTQLEPLSEALRRGGLPL